MEEKKSNKGLICIIIILIILVLGLTGFIVYDKVLANDKENVNENSNQNKRFTGYTGDNIALYEGKNGEKTYFYKNKYSEDNIIYSSSNEILENEEYVEYTLLGEYICNYDGCDILDVVNEKYAIIYDYNYFIYNIQNKKIEDYLNIERIKYSSLKGLYNKANNIVGIVLEKESENYENDYRLTAAYYDVEKQKNIIDFGTYSNIYSDKTVIEKNHVICTLGYSHDDDYRADLYNVKENKIEKNNINGYISGEDIVYYYFGENEVETYISNLYDENFNLIYESKKDEDLISSEDYYITKEDKLIIAINNKFYIYNEDYKLEYTSQEYDEIYNIFKDYIAINENGKLKIIDYNDQEKAELCEITDNNYVHSMISGWYTENGKNGIYMVVSDENALLEISQEEKDEWGITEESYGEVGYEYYYIPSTGGTGRIAAPIGGYAKPVLYLYPTVNNILINITFEKPELLTTTYPKYINEWSVIANENGDLLDKKGRYYYGLYWEEIGSSKIDFSEGFYVEKENASKFLENKLEEIGLNQREANEFIMYWLPILEKNEKSIVYFELTEERQQYNRLNITPNPDSLLRVAIHIKQVDKKVNIKNQKINKFERKGFTAVEWGGTIH